MESTIDFESLLSRLDGNLTREKFKVWREASWEDGTLMPLLGIKDVLLPWPHCSGVFLRHYDNVGVTEVREFAEQCLSYMQRTKPAGFKSKLMTQYVIVPALASNTMDDEAILFLASGELPKVFSTEVPFPVLLDLSQRRQYFGEGKGVWEIPRRLATNVLELGLTRI